MNKCSFCDKPCEKMHFTSYVLHLNVHEDEVIPYWCSHYCMIKWLMIRTGKTWDEVGRDMAAYSGEPLDKSQFIDMRNPENIQ